jgi:hypothetical protein
MAAACLERKAAGRRFHLATQIPLAVEPRSVRLPSPPAAYTSKILLPHAPAYSVRRFLEPHRHFKPSPVKNTPPETQLVPVERVESLIHLARGEKVLLDADLAKLYGVETKALNRAVKRNQSRLAREPRRTLQRWRGSFGSCAPCQAAGRRSSREERFPGHYVFPNCATGRGIGENATGTAL